MAWRDDGADLMLYYLRSAEPEQLAMASHLIDSGTPLCQYCCLKAILTSLVREHASGYCLRAASLH
jgi:hypothetical protein